MTGTVEWGRAVRLELLQRDARSAARRSRLVTPHGCVELPTFMPVGTQASVKGLTIEMVRATGTSMLLGNTYHLTIRPGEQVIEKLGGLHRFMGWDGPILTDSGGFQVFSLAHQAKVTEQHVTFRSHVDGRAIVLSPERAVEIQEALGSDIAMVLDHVISLPASETEVREACLRSVRWAERSRGVRRRIDQAQFGIVQGGLDAALRQSCAAALSALDFDGYAVGGLSVGEEPAQMYAMLDATCPHLPADRPRYLMGVGRPQDMLEAIRRGIDMFDCVLPTRNGRNALAFTDEGPVRMRNLKHRDDPRPLDPQTPSAASPYSRAYLRHLFLAGEMLGPILLTAHNVAYYQRLMRDARQAIEAGAFEPFYAEKMRGWTGTAGTGLAGCAVNS